MAMTVKELKELLKDLNDDAPVTIVNADQDFELEIVEGRTCEDNTSSDKNNFLDLVVSNESLRDIAKQVVRSEEEIRINVPPEQFTNVIINDQVELHILNGYDGYTVDSYIHHEQEDMDDDHDFDSDYLTSLDILHSDLEADEDEE